MDAIEFSELVKVAAEKMKDIAVHQMLHKVFCTTAKVLIYYRQTLSYRVWK